MAKRQKQETTTTPAPAPPGADSLERIEAEGDKQLPRDPAKAAAQLGLPGVVPPSAQEGDKPRRGRRPGSRNGTGAPRGKMSERLATAEAKLAEYEALHAPDREQQLADTANAIGGTVAMMTEMWINGDPDTRLGWRWSPEEEKRWGELWAAPLLPHLPALGTAAPWVMAAFGTGKLVMDKARAAKQLAATKAAKPELTAGQDVGAVAGAAVASGEANK